MQFMPTQVSQLFMTSEWFSQLPVSILGNDASLSWALDDRSVLAYRQPLNLKRLITVDWDAGARAHCKPRPPTLSPFPLRQHHDVIQLLGAHIDLLMLLSAEPICCPHRTSKSYSSCFPPLFPSLLLHSCPAPSSIVSLLSLIQQESDLRGVGLHRTRMAICKIDTIWTQNGRKLTSELATSRNW